MVNGLMTLRQVEEETGLTRSALYRRLREGRLHGIQLDNGAWRVPVQEVARILAGRKPSADTGV